MNHRIRDAVPDGPVIRVKNGRRWRDTNEATLLLNGRRIGRVIYAPDENPVTTHEVKAWVELDEAVEVST